MLGAEPGRYPKKNWGFRNMFVCSDGTPDHVSLIEMKKDGLVISGKRFGSTVFWATEKGCKYIGLNKSQIKNALGG